MVTEVNIVLTYLWITLVVIPSPILIFISSEAIAIIGSLNHHSPLALASALALGQTIGFTTLCLFGDQLAERWSKINQLRKRADIEKYRTKAPLLIAWVSFVGVPPVNICCLAVAAVKTRVLPLIPILFGGRWLRYWIVASVPEYFSDYVNLDLLPFWLQSFLV